MVALLEAYSSMSDLDYINLSLNERISKEEEMYFG
jgi:hypothetical protein